ncbi:MAG: hypothetical protein QXU26_02720, partial [Thermofilaceae archaeon]
CAVCGRRYHVPPEGDRCDVCGSDQFVEPNEANRDFLEKFMEDVNLNNESLLDVLMAIDWDVNVVDNAFLVVRKAYYYDESGRLVGAEPIEVLRGDVARFRLIFDRQGRPGRDDQGRLLMFCPVHRDRAVQVTDEEFSQREGFVLCPECGRQMLVAYYRHDSTSGSRTYYAEGEVLHIKKFTYGLGYGYPPLASLWMKMLILLRQDYFILLGYQLMRSPHGLLLFKGVSVERVEQAWRRLMEYARNNPWMIYPLVLPSAEGVDVQYVDLSFQMREVDFGEYRDELRRAITSMYGITPIFLGEAHGAGRDVMMVLVTNRAVEMEQRMFNEKVFPWLCRQLGVDDFCFELPPSELRDERTFTEIQLSRLELAERVRSLGYEVEVEVNERGEIDWRITGRAERATAVPEAVMPTEPPRRRPRRRQPSLIEGLSGAPEAGEERPRSEAGEQRVGGEPSVPDV